MVLALDSLSEWFQANRLKLNKAKTKFMVFDLSINTLISYSDRIATSNFAIECIEKFKLLGVYFDDKVSLKHHIQHLCAKLVRVIPTLHKLRYVVNKKWAPWPYNPFFLTHTN